MTDEKALTPIDNATRFLEAGGNIENLEKMMELQEKWESNEAKKAFNVAMTAFKANPPKLKKTKDVAYGGTKYSHADLAVITEEISSALSQHNLNATWKTNQKENQIEVTCTITHSLGFSESTTLSSAPDNSGGKNSIQAIGSAITYLQRYTLLALTGLAAHDQDKDGEQPPPEPEKRVITPKTKKWWSQAKDALRRDDNNFDEILKHAIISETNQKKMIEEIKLEKSEGAGNV